VPSASRHHVAFPPPHKSPLRGLGGRRGEAHPLISPGRRGVVVRDLHHHRPGASCGCRPLLRLHPRLRGRRLLPWRRDRCLRPRLHNRGRRKALHNGRSQRRHYKWRRWLRLHHGWHLRPLDGRRLRREG
jgi:hypothetical protein